MAAPKGNRNALGNKGGGAHTVKEVEWHQHRWEYDNEVQKLEAKIKTGVYAVRDVYLLRALKGDKDILKNLANKVLANLHDIRGVDGKDLLAIPDEDKELITAALKYAGTRQLKQKGTE